MVNDYKEWINRAKSCLTIAESYKDETVYLEDLCFNAQQSVEKALKGLIFYLGLKPPKTHFLNELIQVISKRMPIPESIKGCIDLNDYAVFTRYPDDYKSIDEEEYNDAVKIAKNVYNWVLENTKN